MYTKSPISVKEARRILGITGKGLSDDAIRQLIAHIDVLTDVVITQYNDSKNQSSIDILNDEAHTKE